ncbi:MAG: hypothetical protein K9W42_02545 [Candidatus Heimdallarchaeota archaeon]|nr:hypothetical protein [Candidatus Heimdallarchaeota archaeon]
MLTIVHIINILRVLGNSLKNGRSIEQSMHLAIMNINLSSENQKKEWLRLLNVTSNVHVVLDSFKKNTEDQSLARIWILVKHFISISSINAGDKILEIAANLEKNKQLLEKRASFLKAQRYKILFLGTITSVFLGILAGLTPLFTSFISIVRGISFSPTTIKIIPVSLYLIAISAAYFTTDFSNQNFTFKSFIISSLIFLLAFFSSKFILFVIL